jgi:hypothetical protein
MERIKMFSAPHKALRNLLSQVSLLAGKIDYNKIDDVVFLQEKAEILFALLSSHAHTENEFILKPLESKSAGASDHDFKEHEQIEAQQAELQQQILQLNGMQTAEHGYYLYLAVSKFHCMYLEHILHEEEETQELLWKHFTDEELLQLRSDLLQHMSPDERMLWMKYIVPSQTIAENTEILSALKSVMPAPVFDELCNMFKPEMSKKEYEQLLNQL